MIKYTLDKEKQGIAVSEHLYGLFFEDINQAADGGLNAEMVINNSFEFEYLAYDLHNCTVPVTVRQLKDKYWDVFGAGPHYVSTAGGMNENNPSYMMLCVGGIYRMENPGFAVGDWNSYGMALDKGETYNFSMWVKKLGFAGKAEIFIRGARSVLTTVAEIELSGNGGEWAKVSCAVKALETQMGRLVIIFKGNGHLGVDCVSLLPSKVWGDPDKYRNGKLSPRIVKVLKDCHPSFFRFPGGCVVEGDEIFDNMYKWRNTVGPLEERKQIANTWGYMQSYGVGFYEYFALCEDLKMTPLPVLHCGLLCQIRVGEQRGEGYRRIMPGTKEFKHEVIDNVADLLFFALGSADSEDENEAHWAKVRAEMGHPAPFELKYVGIGNENWGNEYFENFDACLMGLRQYEYAGKQTDLIEKFGVTIVTTCGVDIRPQDSNDSWKVINKKYRDTIVDEHVYNSYQWFIDNTKRVHGRVRHAHDERRPRQAQRRKQPALRARRSGVPYGVRAQQRRREDDLLCAAVRLYCKLQVDARPYLVQPARHHAHAQLFRAADVRGEYGQIRIGRRRKEGRFQRGRPLGRCTCDGGRRARGARAGYQQRRTSVPP